MDVGGIDGVGEMGEQEEHTKKYQVSLERRERFSH